MENINKLFLFLLVILFASACSHQKYESHSTGLSSKSPERDAASDNSEFAAWVDLNGVSAENLPEECRNFIKGTMAPRQWRGGFIQVPQDWSKPEGKKISVFYYYDNTRKLDSAKPIFSLNGGPFASYHVRMAAMNDSIQKYDLKKNYILIMMDQRGTGCSVPLQPDGSDLNTLSLYGSEGVARDAEAIRQKLFPVKKLIIFSQSYGGTLTARYLDLFHQNVAEVHTYAPVLYQSMKDFYYYRILRQQLVIDKFFQHYLTATPSVDLRPALQKIASDEGSKYCVAISKTTPEVCGRPLLDAILTGIGNGRGRGLGTTEIWDGAKNTLQLFLESTPDGTDPKYLEFQQKVRDSAGFFTSPGHALVNTIWAKETKVINLNEDKDCAAAEARLQAKGINTKNLPLNECRIIATFGSLDPATKPEVEPKFTGKKLVQTDILKALRTNKSKIPFYLYTGELDAFAQPEALQTLIRSPLIKYYHFKESGHAGWLYEPLFWQNLIKE